MFNSLEISLIIGSSIISGYPSLKIKKEKITDDKIKFINTPADKNHIFCSVFENISNNSHGIFWWIDISIAHHKFFQYIVLNSSS